MSLTIKTAFESLMSFPKATFIYLAVHYSSPYVTMKDPDEPRAVKQEILLSLSPTEIAENYHNEKWWKYIYEATKHYVSTDTPVYYMTNVNVGNNERIVKIFVNEKNPINKIAFDLKNFEEAYYEYKEYGADGNSIIDYYNKLAEIFTEYAIKTELVTPSLVEYFTDLMFDKFDDWRTNLLDYPMEKLGVDK